MLQKYSAFNMLNEFQKNRPMIHAYLNGKSIENYSYNNNTLLGMSVANFMIAFVIVIGIWIWALIELVVNWPKLPIWAKFLGFIGLFLGVGGPVMTLVVVYLTKSSGPKQQVYQVGRPTAQFPGTHHSQYAGYHRFN